MSVGLQQIYAGSGKLKIESGESAGSQLATQHVVNSNCGSVGIFHGKGKALQAVGQVVVLYLGDADIVFHHGTDLPGIVAANGVINVPALWKMIP